MKGGYKWYVKVCKVNNAFRVMWEHPARMASYDKPFDKQADAIKEARKQRREGGIEFKGYPIFAEMLDSDSYRKV